MGLNKLLAMRERSKWGARRDRKKLRRRARDQTAGDSLSGRTGRGHLTASLQTAARDAQALGADPISCEGNDLRDAASETADDLPQRQSRRAAVRRLGHPRWDV